MAKEAVNKSEIIREFLDAWVNKGNDIRDNKGIVEGLKEEHPNEEWNTGLVAAIKTKRGVVAKRGRPKKTERPAAVQAANSIDDKPPQAVEVEAVRLSDIHTLHEMSRRLGGMGAVKRVVDELASFGG